LIVGLIPIVLNIIEFLSDGIRLLFSPPLGSAPISQQHQYVKPGGIEVPPAPLQVGINVLCPSGHYNYTAIEKRNIATVQTFIHAFVRPESIEASHRYVAPGATYFCSSYPAIHSIASYAEHQALTMNTIPDMKIIGIDFIVAKGPYVATLVELTGSNTNEAPKGHYWNYEQTTYICLFLSFHVCMLTFCAGLILCIYTYSVF
jgi:hypothetical protein